MLAEDEEYEDAVLYERLSTPILRSARPELVVSRLRTYALSAELKMIASARTLVERIACTRRSVRVAWNPSQHAATAE
jgi:hypothetical protein